MDLDDQGVWTRWVLCVGLPAGGYVGWQARWVWIRWHIKRRLRREKAANFFRMCMRGEDINAN